MVNWQNQINLTASIKIYARRKTLIYTRLFGVCVCVCVCVCVHECVGFAIISIYLIIYKFPTTSESISLRLSRFFIQVFICIRCFSIQHVPFLFQKINYNLWLMHKGLILLKDKFVKNDFFVISSKFKTIKRDQLVWKTEQFQSI